MIKLQLAEILPRHPHLRFIHYCVAADRVTLSEPKLHYHSSFSCRFSGHYLFPSDTQLAQWDNQLHTLQAHYKMLLSLWVRFPSDTQLAQWDDQLHTLQAHYKMLLSLWVRFPSDTQLAQWDDQLHTLQAHYKMLLSLWVRELGNTHYHVYGTSSTEGDWAKLFTWGIQGIDWIVCVCSQCWRTGVPAPYFLLILVNLGIVGIGEQQHDIIFTL